MWVSGAFDSQQCSQVQGQIVDAWPRRVQRHTEGGSGPQGACPLPLAVVLRSPPYSQPILLRPLASTMDSAGGQGACGGKHCIHNTYTEYVPEEVCVTNSAGTAGTVSIYTWMT